MMDDETTTTQNSSQATKVSQMKLSSRSHSRASQKRHKKTTSLVPGEPLTNAQSKKGDENTSSKSGLDMDKLQSILRGYGSYPAKYR